MKLSTRSRYGVRLMLELALNYEKGLTFLKDAAKNQEISEKYLSQLIIPLRTGGLVVSSRGAHGGYSLAREPKDITLAEIVDILEGEMAVVNCIKDAYPCDRIAACPTRDIWAELNRIVTVYLTSITLDTLVQNSSVRSGVITSMYYI